MTSKTQDMYELQYLTWNGYGYNNDFYKPKKHIKVLWIFPNFSSLLNKQTNRDICTTSNGTGNVEEDYKFQLRMKVLGTNRNLIEFYFMVPTNPLHLKCQLFLVLSSMQPSEIPSRQEFQWCPTNRWIFCTDQYKIDCNSSKVMFEFHFTIDLSVKSEDYAQQCKFSRNMERDKVAKVKLNCDLENLLNTTMFSDLTITSSEGDNISAHKVILGARSPVLRAHFNHDMVEKLTNIIESPFETKVLKALLKYLYTADIQELHGMPEELFKAADFYQILELKNLCEELLIEKITVENVIKTLKFANLYSAVTLKNSCLQFITVSEATSIIKTDGWQEIDSLELLRSITEYIFINK